jgi:hypothetical protein
MHGQWKSIQHGLVYLTDGIYPEWDVFVKAIFMPISDKDKLYAKKQEGKRKDIKPHLEY